MDKAGTIIMLYIVFSMGRSAWWHRKELDFIWSMWKRFRIKMAIEIFCVIAATLTAVVVLITYAPILKWGWWSLFSSDGVGGNILISPFLEFASTSGVIAVPAVLAFFTFVFFLLPFFARAEEEVFRRGHNDWPSIIRRSTMFGFIHLIVGVPIAAGIGLILPGLFFGYKYKRAYEKECARLSIPDGYWAHIDRGDMSPEEYSHRELHAEDEAVLASTVYHTMYNSLIFPLIFLIVIFPPA